MLVVSASSGQCVCQSLGHKSFLVTRPFVAFSIKGIQRNGTGLFPFAQLLIEAFGTLSLNARLAPVSIVDM